MNPVNAARVEGLGGLDTRRGAGLPFLSVRAIEKGYARQRHPPSARACVHAYRLRLASLAAQAFSAEATSVVNLTARLTSSSRRLVLLLIFSS